MATLWRCVKQFINVLGVTAGPLMIGRRSPKRFHILLHSIWSVKVGSLVSHCIITGHPYPDGVYTPVWSVHSKATLLPLPLECTLQPHSEYHRCTLGCHSMDLVKSLTNRNTLQHHFKCTPDGVYTTLPLLWLSFCPCIHSNTTLWTLYICSQDSPTSMPLHAL